MRETNSCWRDGYRSHGSLGWAICSEPLWLRLPAQTLPTLARLCVCSTHTTKRKPAESLELCRSGLLGAGHSRTSKQCACTSAQAPRHSSCNNCLWRTDKHNPTTLESQSLRATHSRHLVSPRSRPSSRAHPTHSHSLFISTRCRCGHTLKGSHTTTLCGTLHPMS